MVPPLAFGDVAAYPEQPSEFGVVHPAVPVWLLRHVVVHGAIGVVTCGDRVIAETADGAKVHAIPGAARTPDGGLTLPTRAEAINLDAGLHLLAPVRDDYAAWLLDLAARFCGAAPREAPGWPAAGPPIVLTPPLDVFWQWESLAAMLPATTARLALRVEARALVRHLLYVPRLGDAAWAMHPATLPVFDALRDTLAGPAFGGRRKLFIADPPAQAPPGRIDELADCAAWNGYEVLTLAAMPLSAQAQAFAGASHIVAPGGAGLANLVFCHPGAAVCELRAAGQTGWPWRHVAALRGLRYGCLVGAAGSGLDVGRLETFLGDARFRDG